MLINDYLKHEMPGVKMSSELCFVVIVSQGLPVETLCRLKTATTAHGYAKLYQNRTQVILAFMFNLTINFAQNSKNIRTNKLSVKKQTMCFRILYIVEAIIYTE